MEWKKINQSTGEVVKSLFHKGAIDYLAQGYCDITYTIHNCTELEHGASWVLSRKQFNGEDNILAGFCSVRDAKQYAEKVNKDYEEETPLGKLLLKIRLTTRMAYGAKDKETSERLMYKLSILRNVATDIFDIDLDSVFAVEEDEFNKCVKGDTTKNDIRKEKLPT